LRKTPHRGVFLCTVKRRTLVRMARASLRPAYRFPRSDRTSGMEAMRGTPLPPLSTVGSNIVWEACSMSTGCIPTALHPAASATG